MSSSKLVVQAAAGALGGEALNVEDVFSTYLYTGNSSSQTITNGIDLDGEGGLVWVKNRDTAYNHLLFDSERGSTNGTAYDILFSNLTNASNSAPSYGVTSFNTNGFTLGPSGTQTISNQTGQDYASWTFRKAPKFFDVVTYTGNGTAGRTISHNLGSVPGCIIVKRTDTSGHDWFVYHRGVDATAPEDYYIRLNETAARTDFTAWNDTAPTSTEFTLGSFSSLNGSGGTFVAYLFAHNDDDGEFGPDGDQDIIKCGSYTGNASEDGPEIDLGWEPQWVLVKAASGTGGWAVMDNMRGFAAEEAETHWLYPNTTVKENSAKNIFMITPTGFKLISSGSGYNSPSGTNYIYIAIRRGPMAVPEDADDVFAIDQENASAPYYTSGFPVDMSFIKRKDNTGSWYIYDRLRHKKELITNTTASEGGASNAQFDYMDGFMSGSYASDVYSWMWRRAPNFFDVVAYQGSTTSTTQYHNLGVAPEMIWIRCRNDSATYWVVGSEYLNNTTGWDKELRLNSNIAEASSNKWDNASGTSTAPTATTFDVRKGTGDVNDSNRYYIAYLFASVDGVSKVGSYTGNGGSGATGQVIDCGFSGQARFVLIKSTSSTGHWWVFDTERGIVAGGDAALKLNENDAENSTYDHIDYAENGFKVNDIAAGVNSSGTKYIYYAIA